MVGHIAKKEAKLSPPRHLSEFWTINNLSRLSSEKLAEEAGTNLRLAGAKRSFKSRNLGLELVG